MRIYEDAKGVVLGTGIFLGMALIARQAERLFYPDSHGVREKIQPVDERYDSLGGFNITLEGERVVRDYPENRLEEIVGNELQKTPEEIKDYSTNDFWEDSEEILLARMIFGEARGEAREEKIAVAYTALNRANDDKSWNGDDIKSVLLAPNQYSCFNSNDVNREKLMNPAEYESREIFEECLDIAKGVISGEIEDPTNGATHYFNPNLANPYWAESELMHKIGRIETNDGQSEHVFYREN